MIYTSELEIMVSGTVNSKNTWTDNSYDKVYHWLKPARGKIKLQKDRGEFEGVSIFSEVGKNWQEIRAFCRNTSIF